MALAVAVDPQQQAFFAAARAEITNPAGSDTQTVRRSWKAAWLTGLVVRDW